MALPMVRPGYEFAACRYPAQLKASSEGFLEELACQLELALELSSGEQDTVCDGETEEPKERNESKFITEEEKEELLEQLSAVEATLQSMLEQEQSKEKQGQLNQEKEEPKEEKHTLELSLESILSIVEESTWSTFRPKTKKEKEVSFLTWYTKKAIYCRKVGSKKDYEWKLNLLNTEEYEKILLFLRKLPEDWNLLFTVAQEFWLDFLDNDFDEAGFLAFLEGKHKDISNAQQEPGNSEHLQTNAGRWTEYLNPLGRGSAKRKYLRPICLTCEVECEIKRRFC